MKLSTITCRGALARLYEYIDGALNPADARGVRLHLKFCRACSKRFRFEEQLLADIREKCRTAAMPDTLRQQIQSTLDEL